MTEYAGLLTAPDVALGICCTFGVNVIVHGGVRCGDRCVIEDNVVLGKAPTLGPRSSVRGGEVGALLLEDGVTVGAWAVILAGAHLGAGCIVEERAFVRERAIIGADSVVGTWAQIDNDVVVGARVRVGSGVYVTAYSVIEDDVVIGPFVVTTNDNRMARRKVILTGVTLREGCNIGAGATLLPGVEVGHRAVVAPGSVVTRDVGPDTTVMGAPARVTVAHTEQRPSTEHSGQARPDP